MESSSARAEPEISPLAAGDAEPQLSGVGLSPLFERFLPAFAREAVRSGGSALVARVAGRIAGLLVTDAADHTASVFAREPVVAEALARHAPGVAVFAEIPLAGPSEPYDVLGVDLGAELPHRFAHVVRVLGPADAPRIAGLLREVYGSAGERWVGAAFAEGERCVGVEIGGELAGLGWLLVAGDRARLHLLTVRADVRRLGVGRDLVAARLWLARQAGARCGLTEISPRNLPSQRIASRLGMRPVGRFDLYGRTPPAPGPATGRVTSA